MELAEPLTPTYKNKQAIVIYDKPQNSSLSEVTKEQLSPQNHAIVSARLKKDNARRELEEQSRISSTNVQNSNHDV
jgi:PHD/YefM family antitoxin component YafN of YafNO toxin-antitoxin module